MHAIKTSASTLLLATTLGALAGALGMVGCDPPECIDGSSAPPAEAAGECAMPPEGTSPETEIVSASAEVLDDGTLVLTWSSMGLQCGTRASDVSVSASA